MARNILEVAAEKARDAAEEDFFEQQNMYMAMKSLEAAKRSNPNLPNIDKYFAAYKVHDLADKKATWYEILEINDPGVDVSHIKKQYRKMALILHPDKNPSVAANGAFNIIQSAKDVLTDPNKRSTYDSQFRPNKRKAGSSYPRPGDDNYHRKAPNTSSGF